MRQRGALSGFRKLLEERAQERPLLCLFDDLQWAEETFLDLLEHLALLAQGAPLLVLCMARPELSERRPSWPLTLQLEPLPRGAVDQLIPETLPVALREQIDRSAAGNPLFLIEMAALAREEEGELSVPASLKALLGARLDQLAPEERHLLQCASVEGELFHRGALLALAPEDAQLTPRLAALVRKELLYSAEAQLPDENAFRFRHLLFRDTAYEALSKAARASLHQRFADWLSERGGEIELEEILGYHLEQAARYKDELGAPEPDLAERASDYLAAAGYRAAFRGDMLGARGLLERALFLTRPRRLDLPLELDLAETHSFLTPQLGAEIAEAAAERARAEGDEAGQMVALVVAAHCRQQFGDPGVDELETLARAALPLLERVQDHAALAHVWRALATVANYRGHFEEWAQAGEQTIVHSRFRTGGWLPTVMDFELALVLGPRPADEAVATLDAVLSGSPHPLTSVMRAWLLAMLARFEEALPLSEEAYERLSGLGNDWLADGTAAEISQLAGDHESAARHFRRSCDALERRGLRGLLSTQAPNLGRSLCALGRYEEAEPLAHLGRELGDEQDFATQATWRQVQALVDAHRGEYTRAEALAREAIAIVLTTDLLSSQGDALCDLAEVLAVAGRSDDAVAVLEEALERYERKKNLAMVAQVRSRLGEFATTAG